MEWSIIDIETKIIYDLNVASTTDNIPTVFLWHDNIQLTLYWAEPTHLFLLRRQYAEKNTPLVITSS